MEIEGQIVASRWCGPPRPPSRSRHGIFAKPDALRRYPKIGKITDMNGGAWDVRDIRPTKHGFNLYFGTPANREPIDTCGPPRLIATADLRDFWETNRTSTQGLLYDLPAGRTTLKRVRKRLGFNFLHDRTEFWTDRIGDLKSLRARDFAAKHRVDLYVTFDWRQKLIGRRARKIGWWRTTKNLAILLSDITLTKAGRKLGISTSQTKRLRDRAKQEPQRC